MGVWGVGGIEKGLNHDLEPGLVGLVKTLQTGRVDIKHADDTLADHERDDNFGVRRGITSNVTRKGVDVWDKKRSLVKRGVSAHTLGGREHRNADTGRFALKRTEDEFVATHQVEPRPVQVWKQIE